MASFKIHVYRGTNAGTESCDFRGDNFIGEAQGDHHRTIPQLEVDPASDELVSKTLELGPTMNALLDEIKEAQPDAFAGIATALGLGGDGPVGLRVGIWDN